MKSREAKIAVLPENPGPAESALARVGTIVACDERGLVRVSLLGSRATVPARFAVPASLQRIRRAIEVRQRVVLIFEEGDPRRPIIIGFIEAPARDEEDPVIYADADRRRVHIVGKDEIVLECGSASVTLRRNGRVVIRGTHVETYSDGTNRIKGSQVRIN